MNTPTTYTASIPGRRVDIVVGGNDADRAWRSAMRTMRSEPPAGSLDVVRMTLRDAEGRAVITGDLRLRYAEGELEEYHEGVDVWMLPNGRAQTEPHWGMPSGEVTDYMLGARIAWDEHLGRTPAVPAEDTRFGETVALARSLLRSRGRDGAAPILRAWARWVALQFCDLWDAPQELRSYLRTGNAADAARARDVVDWGVTSLHWSAENSPSDTARDLARFACAPSWDHEGADLECPWPERDVMLSLTMSHRTIERFVPQADQAAATVAHREELRRLIAESRPPAPPSDAIDWFAAVDGLG